MSLLQAQTGRERACCAPERALEPAGSRGARRVHYFLEVHADARHLQVPVVCGVVDELRHLVQAQLQHAGTPQLQAPWHAGGGSWQESKQRWCTCFARLPKTKSMASMTLLLPLPLGPTTEEKHCKHVRTPKCQLLNQRTNGA